MLLDISLFIFSNLFIMKSDTSSYVSQFSTKEFGFISFSSLLSFSKSNKFTNIPSSLDYY